MSKLKQAVDERILEVARRVGVKIYSRTLIESYAWNGRTIAAFDDYHKEQPRSHDNLVHDIAHYVICAPERRCKPEFGLGSSPDIGVIEAQELMSYDDCQLEEEEASLLGILLEREIGFDPQKTFEHHSWDLDDEDFATLAEQFLEGQRDGTTGLATLKRLLDKGHINENLKPTVLVA